MGLSLQYMYITTYSVIAIIAQFILFFLSLLSDQDQILELLFSFRLPVGVVSGAITALTLCCSAISHTQESSQVYEIAST